jgi:hypothetical protein
MSAIEIMETEDIKWDWEHTVRMTEEEVKDTEAIFKYIMGFGSGFLKHRSISKTDDPLVIQVKYKFYDIDRFGMKEKNVSN